MSFFDFNNADQQLGEVIPAKSLVKVAMKVKPGGHGENGLLKKANSGFEYLETELTVLSSPHQKRKIFANMGVGGVTDGHQTAAKITRSTLRAALESARGINPKDESDQAVAARQVTGWSDFDGLEFALEVGIEKDKNGQYPDKNKIMKVLTPDMIHYQEVMAGKSILPAGVQNQSQGAIPHWQQSGSAAPQSSPPDSGEPAGQPTWAQPANQGQQLPPTRTQESAIPAWAR